MIRPATRADHGAVDELLIAAFGPEEGGRIVPLVADLREGHARSEVVAEVEGAVVGHVLLSRSWLDARERLVEVLVLSPLSVAPEAQGRGTGTALLDAARAEAARLRAPALFLEGDPGFYSARGWEPGERHGFTRPSARIPGPAFQVVVLEDHEPWMTGALVYCEPFWAHDCVGLRDPALAEVERMFE